MRERREREAAAAAAARLAETTKAGAERRKPATDALHGLRTHAWVLVLRGKRGVPEEFFIEPSTGETVSVRSEEYLGVEAVWSSKNYWVNMQDCTEGVLDLKYDLTDTSKWECVAPQHSCLLDSACTCEIIIHLCIHPPLIAHVMLCNFFMQFIINRCIHIIRTSANPFLLFILPFCTMSCSLCQ